MSSQRIDGDNMVGGSTARPTVQAKLTFNFKLVFKPDFNVHIDG